MTRYEELQLARKKVKENKTPTTLKLFKILNIIEFMIVASMFGIIIYNLSSQI